MEESIKIMDVLNRWGYLNKEQIAFLLNKNVYTVRGLLSQLTKKQLVNVNQITRKNIYILSRQGNEYLGREAKTHFLINFYELTHQDLLVKWLSLQKNIVFYQTERELKMINSKAKALPDLIITTDEDKSIYIELERTRKSPGRFKNKLDEYSEWLRNGGEVWWIVPDKVLAKWVEKQINKDGFRVEQHKVIFWNGEEA